MKPRSPRGFLFGQPIPWGRSDSMGDLMGDRQKNDPESERKLSGFLCGELFIFVRLLIIPSLSVHLRGFYEIIRVEMNAVYPHQHQGVTHHA
jgi:hypothetical protein